MRFIIEHPWASGCILSTLSFVLVWTGLRDGRSVRIKLGVVVFFIALIAVGIGLKFTTPRENGRRVTNAFIRAVMENNVVNAVSLLSPTVFVKDDIHGHLKQHQLGVVDAIKYLHKEFPPTSNTVLRLDVFEREKDVLVILTQITRIKRIGSVPNTWKILVSPNEHGEWLVSMLDVEEVAYRSYR